jgi:chromate transporter
VSGAVSWGEALRAWVRVAAYSFGGPAGQIAVMQRILVDEKRWFSQSRFLHAMNYTMLLPGPEAQQLVTYAGWMLHGWRGGLVAGGLFILPGFVSILVLSILYAGFRDVTLVAALFFGLKPAVLAIVVEAVLRIGRRALRNRIMVAIAALAFVAIFVFGVPFPLIIVAAALTGWIGHRLAPAPPGPAPPRPPPRPPATPRLSSTTTTRSRTARPRFARSARWRSGSASGGYRCSRSRPCSAPGAPS